MSVAVSRRRTTALRARDGRSVREQRALLIGGLLPAPKVAVTAEERSGDEAPRLLTGEVERASAASAYTLTRADLTSAEQARFDLLYSLYGDTDSTIDLVDHLVRVIRRRPS